MASHALRGNGAFSNQVTVGALQQTFRSRDPKQKCIICGAPAEVGTRYCGGDGGCPVGRGT